MTKLSQSSSKLLATPRAPLLSAHSPRALSLGTLHIKSPTSPFRVLAPSKARRGSAHVEVSALGGSREGKLQDVIFLQRQMTPLTFVACAGVITSRERRKEQRTNKPQGRRGEGRVWRFLDKCVRYTMLMGLLRGASLGGRGWAVEAARPAPA